MPFARRGLWCRRYQERESSYVTCPEPLGMTFWQRSDADAISVYVAQDFFCGGALASIWGDTYFYGTTKSYNYAVGCYRDVSQTAGATSSFARLVLCQQFVGQTQSQE
jgi:hypothetical protein